MGAVVASKVNEYIVRKTITFANTSGTVLVFEVTGDVEVEVTAICRASLQSAAAANIRLGVSGDTDAMIVDTVATALDSNQYWVDTSPTRGIEPTSARRDYMIAIGDNISIVLDAQVDSGVIDFTCVWRPRSENAFVVAG
jgi:hypothetical protein